MAAANYFPSRYDQGVVTVSHRNVKVTTSVGNANFDNTVKNLERLFDYDVGYIPNGWEHRPDLISNLFYGTPANWWLLMLVNGVTDPFEQLNVGDRILIPKL